MRKPATNRRLVTNNRNFAKRLWGDVIGPLHMRALDQLTQSFGFSIAMRDLLLLGGGWYVTHSGLLSLAQRHHCSGIDVDAVNEFCDPVAARWSFKATVYKSRFSRGFVGHGDADPSNVSPLVRGAEMRVAETRAVNRALRKAYGIGLCSVEELGWVSEPSKAAGPSVKLNGFQTSNGSNGKPSRLRDQLCLLIRQYNLDPTLVKAYAAHFCGTETLKEASRDLVESFISHLSSFAKKDRDGLVCKLNSFSTPAEVKQ